MIVGSFTPSGGCLHAFVVYPTSPPFVRTRRKFPKLTPRERHLRILDFIGTGFFADRNLDQLPINLQVLRVSAAPTGSAVVILNDGITVQECDIEHDLLTSLGIKRFSFVTITRAEIDPQSDRLMIRGAKKGFWSLTHQFYSIADFDDPQCSPDFSGPVPGWVQTRVFDDWPIGADAEVLVRILSRSRIFTYQKDGEKRQRCTIVVEDDTGDTFQLKLWRGSIPKNYEKIQPGNWYVIYGGIVSEVDPGYQDQDLAIPEKELNFGASMTVHEAENPRQTRRRRKKLKLELSSNESSQTPRPPLTGVKRERRDDEDGDDGGVGSGPVRKRRRN